MFWSSIVIIKEFDNNGLKDRAEKPDSVEIKIKNQFLCEFTTLLYTSKAFILNTHFIKFTSER